MVSVQLLTGRVGDNFANVRGDVIEVGEAEAARMVAAGQAKPADDEARKALAALAKAQAKDRPAPEPAEPEDPESGGTPDPEKTTPAKTGGRRGPK